MSAERHEGLARFMPDDCLDPGMNTARDPIPHRGLVADLAVSDDIDFGEPEDTTRTPSLWHDKTVPIDADALDALLEVEAHCEDVTEEQDALPSPAIRTCIEVSQEVDAVPRAEVVAGLLASVAPPEEETPLTPPPPLVVPAPQPHMIPMAELRPAPRAPLLSFESAVLAEAPATPVDPIPTPPLSEPAGLAEPYPRPVAPAASLVLDDVPQLNPAFLYGLAAVPVVILLIWWLV